MDDDISDQELELANEILREIDQAFASHQVNTAARQELSRQIIDDDEVHYVYQFLSVAEWQCLRDRDMPKDGTLLPCHCPSIAFFAFIPLFMRVVLRDIVIMNLDRIFLDCLINRLLSDVTVGATTMNLQLNQQQLSVLRDFLQFVADVCFLDKSDTQTRKNIESLVGTLEV